MKKFKNKLIMEFESQYMFLPKKLIDDLIAVDKEMEVKYIKAEISEVKEDEC
jgi:hypothetical protein